MKDDRRKLVILGQTPPPWHGQAVAMQMLFEHDWGDIPVECVRMSFSEEMDEIGRFRFSKLKHLFRLAVSVRRILKNHPGSVLFYPPASPHWVPFLRDVSLLFVLRRHVGKTAFIFHAGGFGEFVARSPVRRLLARIGHFEPELSLEVAPEAMPPHDVLSAHHWRWSPYGVAVAEVPRSPKPPEATLRVLFVGSLQEGKGVLDVIRTAASLVEAGYGSFVIDVVGRWFSQGFRKEAESLVEELGVSGQVRFPGERTGSEKWKAYAEADIFFFPTHYASEAFPIVLLEALASGLPIVTTEWRGIPKMLEGCPTAHVLPVHAPHAYRDAFIELFEQRERFVEMAKLARSFYESRYREEQFLGLVEFELRRLWEESWDLAASLRLLGLLDARTDGSALPRVLQVFNQYSEQGGEEVWVEQMNQLGGGSFEVGELRFSSREWRQRNAPSKFVQARRLWDNPDARFRLRTWVGKWKPQVLVFHNVVPVGSFGLYREAGELGIPVIQYIHNFRPFSPSGTLWFGGECRDDALRGNPWAEVLAGAWKKSFLKTALLTVYLRRFLKGDGFQAVRKWVAVSEFMREKFVAAGVPEDKVVTLRHCWNSLSKGVSCEDEGFYLFLGRLVPEKGVRVVIEAWNHLARELGEACPPVVIAGAGREEVLVQAAQRENPRIRYAGFVSGPDKISLLKGCRAVVAPSIWWEPLGLIVYEAYDFGKPVLAARSGGLTETVIEGQTGFSHEAGSVEGLIANVRALEGLSPDARKEMGASGKAWLTENASPEVWRTRFMEILRSVGVE